MGTEGNPVVNIRRILKGFTLFNVDQSDGLPIEAIEDPSCSQSQLVESNAYQAVDALLASHNVKVRFGGNHTFYDSRLDLIGMPKKQHLTMAIILQHSLARTDALDRSPNPAEPSGDYG